MNKEQERQYKDSENRIDQKERYAVWGKQYGVGGVITATSQCSASKLFWATQRDFDCVQNIQVMDAKTGEVFQTFGVDWRASLHAEPPGGKRFPNVKGGKRNG